MAKKVAQLSYASYSAPMPKTNAASARALSTERARRITKGSTALRDWRERERLTQIELAALLGVPQGTLSAWETGAIVPSHASCVLIERVTGVTHLAWLVRE